MKKKNQWNFLMKLCYNDVDFDLLNFTFWALKMHQNTSLGVQIFKISRGRPPRPPQQEGDTLSLTLPQVRLCRITESERIQFPPSTFYNDENPDREHGFLSTKCKTNYNRLLAGISGHSGPSVECLLFSPKWALYLIAGRPEECGCDN